MGTHTRLRVLLLFVILFVVVLTPASVGAAKPPPPQPITVRLTSITIDPEDATGVTTNAPGAWSTSLGDGLSQVGVVSKGHFLNIPQPTFDLGEIDIPLVAGDNVFTLYGTGIFPLTTHYGAVLFFDNRQVNPQIAVFNANKSKGNDTFSVQRACPDGTILPDYSCMIMGGANGGWFFDYPPGVKEFVAKDGSTVEVTHFTINAFDSKVDKVGHYSSGRDGTPDAVAKLTLTVTPAKK